MTRVEMLIADVEAARTALLGMVEPLGEGQCSLKPSPQQWSILEIVEHLYLAELSGVSKIWAALDALEAGKGWTGERPHRGQPIEHVIARTWKPREVAPPIATPHIGGSLRFWLAATRSLEPILAELGRELEGVDLEAVVFPHYLSGPLDADQRLQFLRYHIERHIGQLTTTRASFEGVG